MLNSYKIFITSVSFLCIISGHFEEEKEAVRLRYFYAIAMAIDRYNRAIGDQSASQEREDFEKALKKAHSAGFLLIEVVINPPVWVVSQWNKWRFIK